MQLWTLADICGRTKYSRWTIRRHRRKFPDYPKPVGLDGDPPRFVASEIKKFYLGLRKVR